MPITALNFTFAYTVDFYEHSLSVPMFDIDLCGIEGFQRFSPIVSSFYQFGMLAADQPAYHHIKSCVNNNQCIV